MMKIKLLGFFLALCLYAFPQASNTNDNNPLNTGLRFLDYPTNARIGAFGEIATVSSPFYPDAGLYQNPALISNHGRLIEHETKGGRNYLTWGFGAGAYGFTLDYKKINSDAAFNDDFWALTLGFRTRIPNPLFRF